MGFTEINIDERFQLFGDFYHACVDLQNSNPFLAAHRTFMAAASDAPTSFHLGKWNQLNAFGILAANAAGDKFIPLHAQVVLPDGVGTEPFPLAVLIHGQASTWSGSGASVRETKSYRGYRYLQEHMAEKGVASVSVNVNVANFLGGEPYWQPMERLEISMLILSLLFQLSGTAVTTGQPILFKKSDGTLVPLQDGLALTGTFSSSSPERQLQNLKTSLTGKISMATLGFMGHSRGGEAVQLLQPLFTARVGTAPAVSPPGSSTNVTTPVPTGTYNSNSARSNSYSMHQHLYHHIMNIMATLGNPTMAAVKTIIALQPAGKQTLLNSDTAFYMVLASSHDEDAQEDAFNNYEDINTPKAMLFSHGASHARFNSVWRQLPATRRKINQQIMCQSPIRMLSNAGHENLCKATVGNAFLAGLLSENHRYGFFTGEIRATSLSQDISRAWKFPFPFATPPAIRVKDGAGITALNTTTSAAVTGTAVSNLHYRQVASHDNYINAVAVTAFTRPANQGLAIRIPIVAADTLSSRTHFSFRYTKEYDSRSASARRSVNLRHYTLRLKNGTTIIGSPIDGSAVPSLHHAAYPTMDLDPNSGSCVDDTGIVMQTAEVPLSQFLGTQPVSDLNQVTQIEITINPLPSAGSTDETFFFLDFLLTTRNLPAAPAGFAIP